jgi:hypothetical protein
MAASTQGREARSSNRNCTCHSLEPSTKTVSIHVIRLIANAQKTIATVKKEIASVQKGIATVKKTISTEQMLVARM